MKSWKIWHDGFNNAYMCISVNCWPGAECARCNLEADDGQWGQILCRWTLRRVERCCVSARKSRTSSRLLAWIWTKSPKLNIDPSHLFFRPFPEAWFLWFDDLKWGTMRNWRDYDMVPSWSWQIRLRVFLGTWGAIWSVAHHGWNHRIPMDRTSRDFCTLDWKKRICRIFVVGFVKMFWFMFMYDICIYLYWNI